MDVPTSLPLDSLVSAYRAAADVAKAANEQADELKARLKLALQEAAQAADPNDPLLETGYRTGDGVKVSLKVQESWRVNVNKLKAAHPEVYAAYAERSSTTVLRLSA